MASPLLYTKTDNGFLFKPANGTQNYVMSLTAQDTTLLGADSFPQVAKIIKIAAIIGIVRLKTSKYVMLAERVEKVGAVNGHMIWKVVEYSIQPIGKQIKDADESEYLALLHQQLDTAPMFFSYTYDLTNSLQRNTEASTKQHWNKCDERFFWNYAVTEELRNLSGDDYRYNTFIQPIIYGYAHFVETTTQNKKCVIGLVTRRSRHRAGTRYFRRGIDEDGNVANYNETEQFLQCEGEVFAYLQTRGSVPVQWAEINNLKYKPMLAIGQPTAATKKHFDQQVQLYGQNYLVNLVNQKGYEEPVKRAYETAVASLNNPKVQYVYFDFHHECRKMQWHRVKLLIDHLTEIGMKPDFFHIKDGRVIKTQTSIVRTNCMDCLDRTNVVQSVLASWVLEHEFKQLDMDSNWEADKNLLNKFQNFWADNADAVSNSYSGTGALKTDFTRTGKRTKIGAWNDFCNSVSRYYQNNLSDGPRQDSYDLFLGGFKPYEVATSPFGDKRPLLPQSMPLVILCSTMILMASIFFPKDGFFSNKNLGFLVSSVSVIGLCFSYIMKNGMQFVYWPRLRTPEFLEIKDTHSKENHAKGIQFIPSSNFKKPESSRKKD